MTYVIEICSGGGVGKSSICSMLTANVFPDDPDPTMGDHYLKEVVVAGIPSQMSIWERSWDEHFIPDEYTPGRQGYALTFSLTSRSSFYALADLHEQNLRVHYGFECPLPTVIMGNKCDLEEERQVTEEEALKFAESLGCPYFETSAKDNVNLEVALSQLIREIWRCYASVDFSKKRRHPPRSDAAFHNPLLAFFKLSLFSLFWH